MRLDGAQVACRQLESLPVLPRGYCKWELKVKIWKAASIRYLATLATCHSNAPAEVWDGSRAAWSDRSKESYHDLLRTHDGVLTVRSSQLQMYNIRSPRGSWPCSSSISCKCRSAADMCVVRSK